MPILTLTAQNSTGQAVNTTVSSASTVASSTMPLTSITAERFPAKIVTLPVRTSPSTPILPESVVLFSPWMIVGELSAETLQLKGVLGYVVDGGCRDTAFIAVSSFLAAVAERKREFGIMSSIGLADEVLYFFLVESGITFLTAYLVGVLGAGVAVALVIPEIATLTAWGQAAGTSEETPWPGRAS